MSSYDHIIKPSYHHIIISVNQKSASQFWPKSLGKNRNRLFYPSTKNHKELIFWTSGVTFRDERRGNAQKFTARPNRYFTCFVMTFEILQNLQTAEKSRGWLRFRRFFDENDRGDPNFFFKIFASPKLSRRRKICATSTPASERASEPTNERTNRGRWHGGAI